MRYTKKPSKLNGYKIEPYLCEAAYNVCSLQLNCQALYYQYVGATTHSLRGMISEKVTLGQAFL